MNVIIILFDLLGIVAFAAAAFFAYRNHSKLKDASNLWLYFGSSSIVACLWGASLIAREVGITAAYDFESMLFFAVIFLFTLLSIASLFDFIKMHGSLKK